MENGDEVQNRGVPVTLPQEGEVKQLRLAQLYWRYLLGQAIHKQMSVGNRKRAPGRAGQVRAPQQRALELDEYPGTRSNTLLSVLFVSLVGTLVLLVN